MVKTKAIVEFLENYGRCKFLTTLYNPSMEVQVNVAQDTGIRTKGEYKGKHWVGWKDETTGETWKSFRIPWGAKNAEATYVDSELKFDLSKHAEGIGMTGWNWVNKSSIWVGFDFDSIANHKTGLSEEELEKLRIKLFEIDYVTMLKSTSGKGYHLYIFFDKPINTETHTEHAALARSALSVLSSDTGINLHTSVDVCGAVLWCWHRKQEGTDGLTVLKKGNLFNSEKIPPNWRDGVKVVNGTRKRISFGDNFESLFSTIKFNRLDDEHLKLINFLKKNGQYDSWWDSDYNMLVCHTLDLKKAHQELKLIGIFETNSSGSSKHNCFCFPERRGVWSVRRYSPGVKEHPSWKLDASGWTRCTLNEVPDVESACRSCEGIELAKGGFFFDSVKKAITAIQLMGTQIILPDFVFERKCQIFERKDRKLVLSFQRIFEKNVVGNSIFAQRVDPDIPNCLPNKKGDLWEMVVEVPKALKEVQPPDFLIRNVISENVESGWFINIQKSWVFEPKSNVVTVLNSLNDYDKSDVDALMSKCILNPWYLVNIPFEDEYTGDRKWNKDAATLSITPEEGNCKTWNKILEHCGGGLNEAVLQSKWCRDNAIVSGADYLRVWIASLFQKPSDPLPYLFFFGPQNSGKSTLHEALAMLFKRNRGYIRADNALINQSGFNAELANAVLCVVEEVNLTHNKDALNRIKDWVTGKTLSINAKFKTAFDVHNTSHWIQCANDLTYCPVFPGDTRIVVCLVNSLKEEIPKNTLFQSLEKEKAAFLFEVLNLELPDPISRLSIPCISTQEKIEMESLNTLALHEFIDSQCFVKKGHMLTFEEFYNRFYAWLHESDRLYWTRQKVAREFPRTTTICKGKYGTHNETIIGNISLDGSAENKDFEYFFDINVKRINKRSLA